eukprot:CAMPEP_0175715260 /NCGR_PEP_ID=MMETSP0097-20121207/42542_1 /TAXON_ID=311494 /ORGANISM="Alexandrium monilatum, Strain CCMP3105" /LENGTH=164 /DNA_ID=CAMNT_0017022777 /DNA_START=33 /DNA_END=528 /DNA_ORIENTATION=+
MDCTSRILGWVRRRGQVAIRGTFVEQYLDPENSEPSKRRRRPEPVAFRGDIVPAPAAPRVDIVPVAPAVPLGERIAPPPGDRFSRTAPGARLGGAGGDGAEADAADFLPIFPGALPTGADTNDPREETEDACVDSFVDTGRVPTSASLRACDADPEERAACCHN